MRGESKERRGEEDGEGRKKERTVMAILLLSIYLDFALYLTHAFLRC